MTSPPPSAFREFRKALGALAPPVLLALTLPALAHAGVFDGKRQGLVLSSAIGFSPDVTVGSRNLRPRAEHMGIGLITQASAGVGLSDHDVILCRIRATEYTLSYWDAKQSRLFAGPVLVHYFGRLGRSFEANVGAGVVKEKTTDFSCGCFYYCIFPPCPPYSCENPCPAVVPPEGNGFACQLGVGYEFNRLCEIGLHGLFGKISDPTQGDWTIRQFGMEVQVSGF